MISKQQFYRVLSLEQKNIVELTIQKICHLDIDKGEYASTYFIDIFLYYIINKDLPDTPTRNILSQYIVKNIDKIMESFASSSFIRMKGVELLQLPENWLIIEQHENTHLELTIKSIKNKIQKILINKDVIVDNVQIKKLANTCCLMLHNISYDDIYLNLCLLSYSIKHDKYNSKNKRWIKDFILQAEAHLDTYLEIKPDYELIWQRKIHVHINENY